MISLTGEYALRAMVCLASHPGRSLTADSLSRITAVPVGYLAKIMQGLTRAQLVGSQRGPHGGFILRRPAGHITIYDVVKAADQLPRVPGLASGGSHAVAHGLLRRLQLLLATSREQWELSFRSTSIATLLEPVPTGAGVPSRED